MWSSVLNTRKPTQEAAYYLHRCDSVPTDRAEEPVISGRHCRAGSWLVEKLRRTLRSLLRQQDGALRYPASRFLVRLGGTTPSQARHFARRLAWEWDAYLGQRLSVRTQVEPIRDGDLTASLRRVSFRPDDG